MFIYLKHLCQIFTFLLCSKFGEVPKPCKKRKLINNFDRVFIDFKLGTYSPPYVKRHYNDINNFYVKVINKMARQKEKKIISSFLARHFGLNFCI